MENSSAYGTLKARGPDLITNDSLRAEIARRYDVLYEAIEEYEIQILDHHRGALKPYYVTHLRDLEIESTTPRDYAALVQDQEYAHLIAGSGCCGVLSVHAQVQRRESAWSGSTPLVITRPSCAFRFAIWKKRAPFQECSTLRSGLCNPP